MTLKLCGRRGMRSSREPLADRNGPYDGTASGREDPQAKRVEELEQPEKASDEGEDNGALRALEQAAGRLSCGPLQNGRGKPRGRGSEGWRGRLWRPVAQQAMSL